MANTEYDVIVIGAGAVGENVADRIVLGGLKPLIIESELVGGECSYWACMPSKALLRGASTIRAAKNVAGADAAVTGEQNIRATLKRRDRFTSEWDDVGQVHWLTGARIDLVRGHAEIVGEKQVSVEGSIYTARYAVVVCTGSAAKLPDIPGLAELKPWQSREATSVRSIPKRMTIVGSGVVGVEMATAYAAFGTEVTMLSRSGILSGMEDFAGEHVEASLKEMGVTVMHGVAPTHFDRNENEIVTIELDNGETITTDEVLVATGRVPRTMDLGLESIGLTPGDWLDVDDTLKVKGFDWLYAAGDVNHRALLTHQGKYQARAVGDVISARVLGKPVKDARWGTHVATADHEVVPQVVFSDPEVASVGLTAQQAEDAGYDIRVVDYNLGWVAGASLHADGYKGQARMIVDEKHHVIIGVTFVGPDVAEMLHAATIAIVGRVPIDLLWHAVPAYPTMSEVWLRLLETYGR